MSKTQRPLRYPTTRRSDRNRGTGLLMILIISTILAGVVTATVLLSLRSSEANAEWRAIESERVACESVADILRAELVADFESSGLMGSIWLTDVRNGIRFAPSTPRTYAGFPGVEARIGTIAPAGAGQLWVEVLGQTLPGSSRSEQVVRQRIDFGNSAVMDFALLAKTVNCMFCHLKVTGDVGSLADLRPGWGSGNRGRNSGQGSEIHGDVYVAGDAIDGTGSHSGTLNGTEFFGDLYDQYHGPKLPKDSNGDGDPDFPTIDPTAVSLGAKGSIWADASPTGDSGMWVTPMLGSWDPATAPKLSSPPSDPTGTTWVPGDKNAVGSVIDGNVTLVGTADNPIQLNGDVFVTGDVVIKGVVEGKGAIYAGRNVYAAGDVVYKNPPAEMKNDADAVAEIKAGKDELRLAARGSIVLGDWTYESSSGDLLGMKDRQAQSFLDDSFHLDDVRHYQAAEGGVSSNELTQIGNDFYNDLGDVVPPEKVVTVDSADTMGSDEPKTQIFTERFDSVIAPGQVLSDGSFHSWMSQSDYRDVLGQKEYSDMMWRLPTPKNDSSIDKELGAGWADNVSSMSNSDAWFDNNQHGDGLGQYVRKTGSFLQVVETGEKPWSTQVTRVDAFLYSNKRIGGLTAMVDNLVINGGLVSEDIQVLAPGRGNHTSWYRDPRHGDAMVPISWRGEGAILYDEDGNPIDPAFYINYDYRLRNGGLGFNLIPGTLGERIYYVVERGAH